MALISPTMTTEPFITLAHVTARIGKQWLLDDTNWQICRGQNWVIWGANGAGKTTLARVLTGEAAVVQGQVHRHYLNDGSPCRPETPVAMVSSEHYHQLFYKEQVLDHARHFSGRIFETTTAGMYLDSLTQKDSGPGRLPMVAALNLSGILSKPLKALSSGEMRKLLIAGALAKNPGLLILDEPFNGLDEGTRSQLRSLMADLALRGTQMILIVHRLEEIPDCFTHILEVDGGRVVRQGPMAEFAMGRGQRPGQRVERKHTAVVRAGDAADHGQALVRMRHVTVRYGQYEVLRDLSWTIRSGENWALTGPNGAGKSTLLHLITGSQLQAYANDITIFGHPKGSGASIWQIRQQIGYLGDGLQARYQKQMTALDVIASGFFDSVGLFRLCTPEQCAAARNWARTLSLADLMDKSMNRLSFGQQRMVLIARAVVKSPRLLILDEPCNGLDIRHRRKVIDMLDKIGRGTTTHLLYVSHQPDDMPQCMTHQLHLENGKIKSVGVRTT